MLATHRLVIDALEANWSRFQGKGVSDVGILIDWCGLYQAPRDDEQQRVFGAALKAINQAGSQPRTLGTLGTRTGPRPTAHAHPPRAFGSGTRTVARRSGW